MRVIYKYSLATAAKQILMVPPLTDKVNGVDRLAKPSEQFLYLDVQRGVPTIWFMCDKGREPEAVEVFTRVTGFQGFEADGTKHVGSYLLHDGAFVGHVFMK